MPVYTYRREDGTSFDYRQRFLDDPLTVDPETGQRVVRVIQPASVIFKGSGFYINDSKSASHSAISGSSKSEKSDKADDKPAASGSETTTPAKTPAKAPAETAAD